jgi:hypothetical protein
VSLTTPTKLEELRAKLYAKAKAEPAFQFYALYDKIHRGDVLTEALRQSKQKKGAAGVDGQTFEQIEAHGEERWLKELQQELQRKTYRPQPVRRVLIPKPGGGERPLGDRPEVPGSPTLEEGHGARPSGGEPNPPLQESQIFAWLADSLHPVTERHSQFSA